MKTWQLGELKARLIDDSRGPYQNVYLQECKLISTLINIIYGDLKDLDLAFKGEITVTNYMEKILESIEFKRIALLQGISSTVSPDRLTLLRYAAKLHRNKSTLKGYLIWPII